MAIYFFAGKGENLNFFNLNQKIANGIISLFKFNNIMNINNS